MAYLDEIEVVDNDDIKSGFEIKFNFQENPYFTNKTLVKSFFVNNEGEVDNKSAEIKWKEVNFVNYRADGWSLLLISRFLNQGKNIMAESEKTEGEDEEDFGHEFILWLTTTNDEASDEVADIIKDDLWSNPYQV